MIRVWRTVSRRGPHPSSTTYRIGGLVPDLGDPVGRMNGTADVAEKARQRPAQRHETEPLGRDQRGVRDTPGLVCIPGAAQRRGEHHIRLDGVSHRAGRRREFHGALGVADGSSAVASEHRQFGRHPAAPHRQSPRRAVPERLAGPLAAAVRTTRSGRCRGRRRRVRSGRRRPPRRRIRRAQTRGRPRTARRRGGRAAAGTTPWCSMPTRPAAPSRRTGEVVQVGEATGVPALAPCGHGSLPGLQWRLRCGQWPAAGVATEGSLGHDGHRIGTLPTGRSVQRQEPSTAGLGDQRVANSTMVNS